MAELSPFEQLIAQFEAPVVTEAQTKRLLEYMDDTGRVYLAFFESYISNRIHANIHPERLLNMANHFEKHIDTVYLSLLINRRLAASIIYKNEGYDHLYYMCRHDTRTHRYVLNELIIVLSHMRESALKII